MRKTVFYELNECLSDIQDLIIYSKYLGDEDMDRLLILCESIHDSRKDLQVNINPVLIALKEYTEGRASWERAGRVSDLHIFGLRKYCEDKGVDWSNLRVNEYYGPVDAQVVKDEWEILNPNHEYYPIDFTGGNPIFKSDMEFNSRRIHNTFYTKKGQYLVSDFLWNLHGVFDAFLDKGIEVNVNDFKEDIRLLERFCEILWVYKEEDFEYFTSLIDECNYLLIDAVDESDVNLIHESIDLLKDNISDGCYFATVSKKENKGSE